MKRKIMLGATAGLIGALAIVGAAFAQEGPGDSGPGDSIKDRVAEILGIDRETIDSAMKTARDWNRDANQEERLAVLVEQEVITQAQAGEIDHVGVALVAGCQDAAVVQPVQARRVAGHLLHRKLEGQPRATGPIAHPVGEQEGRHAGIADGAAVCAAVGQPDLHNGQQYPGYG